jgi:hypothetical protein
VGERRRAYTGSIADPGHHRGALAHPKLQYESVATYKKKSRTIDVAKRITPKRAKAKARYESARERLYNPLATNTPFTRKHNHPKAGRISPPTSDRTKKKRNTAGTSHIHLEGLDDPSISPSPAVVVLVSSSTAPLSGIEHIRA